VPKTDDGMIYGKPTAPATAVTAFFKNLRRPIFFITFAFLQAINFDRNFPDGLVYEETCRRKSI